MKLGELKNTLKNFKGVDNWEIHILIEELPNKIHTTECTKLGVCIDDKVIILGFGKCPHCKGE